MTKVDAPFEAAGAGLVGRNPSNVASGTDNVQLIRNLGRRASGSRLEG
jgi:hypothetical protein